MAYAREVFTGPAASYAFSFPFISADDVKLYVAGVEDTGRTIQNENPASGGEVVPSVTPGASAEVVVVRETSRSARLVDYTQPSILTEEDLDNDSLQAFYMAQESLDGDEVALGIANAVTSVVAAAEAAAILAQTGAEAAQTAAELAQTGAEAAELGAETSETDAGAFASAAAISAALAQAAADAVANPFHPAGTLDASGGAYPAGPAIGAMYRVTVLGTVSGVDYEVGDFAAYTSDGWYKFDNTDPLTNLAKAGGTMTGDIDMDGNAIIDADVQGATGTVGILTETSISITSVGDSAATLSISAATAIDFVSVSGARYVKTLLITNTNSSTPTFTVDTSGTVVWLTDEPTWASQSASQQTFVQADVIGATLFLSAKEYA